MNDNNRQKESLSVRKAQPSSAVVEDVRDKIRSGQLEPGDKLKSIRQLTSVYDISQYAVQKALRKLADQGLLASKKKSGYYVRDEAQSLLEIPPDSETQSETSDNSENDAASDSQTIKLSTPYYVPRASAPTISVYVSELYDSTIEVWDELLRDFEQVNRNCDSIRLLSCQDGHFEEVIPREKPELVVAAGEVLANSKADDYVPPTGDKLPEPSDFVQPIADRWRAGPGFLGIPFSLTYHRTYINTDRVQPDQGRTWDDPSNSDFEILMHNIWHWLLMRGGLRYEDDLIRMNEPRAREALELFHELPIELDPDMTRFARKIARGQYTHTVHFTYITTLLQERAKCCWQATGLPFTEDGTDLSRLLLIAVRKDYRNSAICSALAEYLMSSEAQNKYGELGANLPALRKAALSPSVRKSTGLSRKDLEEQIEHLFVPVPNGQIPYIAQKSRLLVRDILASTYDVDMIIDRMKGIVSDLQNQYG